MKTITRLFTTALVPSLLIALCVAKEDEKKPQVFKIQVEGQPLFKGPSPALPVLSRLTLGTDVVVLRARGPWKEVKGEKLAGWIQGPRKSVLGGKPVDADYLRSKATAKMGAGLVTKGFSKSYAKQHNVLEADSKSTEEQLTKYHFTYEAYETFLDKGHLSMSEALEEPDVAPAPKSAKPPGMGDRPDFSGDQDLLDSLKRGRAANMASGEILNDPLYFAKNFSYEEEEAMGWAVAQRLAAGKIHPSAAMNEYINLIGATLVENSDRADIPYVFTLLKSPEINAFAAPGGYIFITTGCILACKNEAELAAVLGHEVAHVARRHAARQLDDHRTAIVKNMKRAQLDETLEEFYGPMDPAEKALISELQSMADIHYKSCTASWGQKFELEADKYGMLYASAAGWDHSGLFAFLKVLLKNEGVTVGAGWDSHPPAKVRLKKLREVVQEGGLQHSGNFLKKRFEQRTHELHEH